MNNLLTSNAPWSVSIAEHSYKFDADFRNFIKFEMLLNDPEITDEFERYRYMVRLFFVEIPPVEYAEETVQRIVEIYQGGVGSERKSSSKSKEPVYDLVQDSDLIYSAFQSDYKIDLNSIPQLHWWKFKALFLGLKADNLLVKIMEYRGADTSKMKGEQKQHYEKMRQTYMLKKISKNDSLIKQIEERLMRGESIADLISTN